MNTSIIQFQGEGFPAKKKAVSIDGEVYFPVESVADLASNSGKDLRMDFIRWYVHEHRSGRRTSIVENQTVPSHPTSPFDQVRKVDEAGLDYWSSRDLAIILSYADYNKFENVVDKAETACLNSGQRIEDHFRHVADMIEVGKGAKRKVTMVHLTRYACYLIVQNADPRKEHVALGQTYFAVQTRRQELSDSSINQPANTQKPKPIPPRNKGFREALRYALERNPGGPEVMEAVRQREIQRHLDTLAKTIEALGLYGISINPQPADEQIALQKEYAALQAKYIALLEKQVNGGSGHANE